MTDVQLLEQPGYLGQGTPTLTAEHLKLVPVLTLPSGLFGIDVSHYQSTVEVDFAASAGCRFVIVKASEALYGDPSFAAHVARANARGLVASAYHFVRAGNGAAQGRTFLSMITGRLKPGTRVWLDFESGDHQTLHDIMDVVEGAGWAVGIYTGGWYWGPNGSSTCARCAAHPLWLSGYTASMPAPPAPFKIVAIWQFTDRYQGHSLDCSVTSDLNWLQAAAPAPAPPPPSIYDGKVVVRAMQTHLHFQGAEIDGIWGPQVENGVNAIRLTIQGHPESALGGIVEVQTRIGTTPDGIPGPQFYAALEATIAHLQGDWGTLPDGRWGPATEIVYQAARAANLAL